MTTIPPRFATSIVRACCPRERREEIEGDLLEMFTGQVEREGLARARRAYVFAAVDLCLRQLGARTGRVLLRPIRPHARMRVYPARVLASLAVGAALLTPIEEPSFVFARNALLIAYPVIELLLLARVFSSKRRGIHS